MDLRPRENSKASSENPPQLMMHAKATINKPGTIVALHTGNTTPRVARSFHQEKLLPFQTSVDV